MIPIYKFVDVCLAQKGDKYVFAVEAQRTDPNPEAFDCSELVEWACEQVGIGDAPDGSMNQRAWALANKTVSVEKAIETRGALLFRDISITGIGHVAVSLGNGQTIEARGTDYGVGVFSATEGRVWTDAGHMPGFDYSLKFSPPERVQRWVCFGRYGGRYGHSRSLSTLHHEIKEAEKATGAAVVIFRKEPKDLKLVKGYPRWRAEKRRKAA